MKKTLAIFAICIAPTLGMSALANDEGSTGSTGSSERMSFEKFDSNADGYLSRDELKSASGQSAELVQTDKDGDGRVSKAEFEAKYGSASGTGSPTGGSGASGSTGSTGSTSGSSSTSGTSGTGSGD